MKNCSNDELTLERHSTLDSNYWTIIKSIRSEMRLKTNYALKWESSYSGSEHTFKAAECGTQ